MCGFLTGRCFENARFRLDSLGGSKQLFKFLLQAEWTYECVCDFICSWANIDYMKYIV